MSWRASAQGARFISPRSETELVVRFKQKDNEAHLRCMKNEAAFGYEACLRHTEKLECASLHASKITQQLASA